MQNEGSYKILYTFLSPTFIFFRFIFYCIFLVRNFAFTSQLALRHWWPLWWCMANLLSIIHGISGVYFISFYVAHNKTFPRKTTFYALNLRAHTHTHTYKYAYRQTKICLLCCKLHLSRYIIYICKCMYVCLVISRFEIDLLSEQITMPPPNSRPIAIQYVSAWCMSMYICMHIYNEKTLKLLFTTAVVCSFPALLLYHHNQLIFTFGS